MREMKDSGVEWIGEIPKEWTLNKIGSVYEERNTKVSDRDYQALSVTKQGIVLKLETAAKTDDGDNRKLIKKNDFVINSRSDRRGSCGISEYDGSCSLINTVLQPRKNICNAYYGFVFHSELFADEFYRWGSGIVDDLWSTKWSSMKNIYIPSPNVNEQKKIADYLDNKCSQIDNIIEKEQHIIERLKAYKQSRISEEINDSSYSILALGKCIKKIEQGWSPSPDEHDSAENWKVLSLAAVKEGKFHNMEIKPFWGNTKKCEQLRLFNGDFLLTRANTRELVGSSCIVDNVLEKTIFSDLIYRVSFDENMLSPQFASYYLQSTHARQQIERDAHGSNHTMVKITHKDISSWKIYLPPIEKQKQICEKLKELDMKVTWNIEKRMCTVSKLTAYKKSLIYEVVTGKKEVTT